MKIYTKTGDAGDTGLFDGQRVPKSDPRVEAYGDVDELNAWLGLVRAHGPGHDIDAMLEAMQRHLFAIGALLADPRHKLPGRGEKGRGGRAEVGRAETGIHQPGEKPPAAAPIPARRRRPRRRV